MTTRSETPAVSLDVRDQVTFREVFARSRIPMLIADDERRYVDANPAACALLGLEREAIVHLTVGDMSPPEARDRVEEIWRAMLRDGSVTKVVRLRRPDGSTFSANFSATAAIEPGRHLGILLASGEPEQLDAPVTDEPQEGERLSPREREVMALLAMGSTGEDVAARLTISPETVRNHVRGARQKLGARTRAHAIALAIRRGELEL